MAGLLLQSLLILLLSLALRSAGQAQDTRARIVNGVQCPRGTHPWQVALYDKGVFQCAGVLVSKQWVLTVAHCLLSEYVAQMGSDLLVDENAQKIRVTKLFLHPRYDPTTNIHDIMLLKLSSPAKLSPSVRTISVPSSCRQPRRNCALSGWGSISTHVVKNASELMCSNVHLISYKDCKKFYPTLLRKFTICAAPHDKFSVACKGDLGSPLMCQGSLQGLVSSNYFPCRPPFDPVIYTRVCRYSKWIYETMRKNS